MEWKLVPGTEFTSSTCSKDSDSRCCHENSTSVQSQAARVREKAGCIIEAADPGPENDQMREMLHSEIV